MIGSAVPSSGTRGLLRAAFDRLPVRLKRNLIYLRAHGRLPRVRQPVGFTEKVNWRIINDRRNELAVACDKLLIKERIGAMAAQVEIIPTIWQGSKLGDLVGVELPEYWVLKPNHAAGLVCFGRGLVESGDLPALEHATEGWLVFDKWKRDGEWGYRDAQRTFIVEPMIGGGPNPPRDLKGYVFGGRLAFWHLDIDRGRGQTRAFVSPDGERLPFGLRYPDAGPVEPPENLKDLNRAAEALAEGLEMVRVDLYSIGHRVIFGELTVYPNGAINEPRPRGTDEKWGQLWSLPPLAEVR